MPTGHNANQRLAFCPDFYLWLAFCPSQIFGWHFVRTISTCFGILSQSWKSHSKSYFIKKPNQFLKQVVMRASWVSFCGLYASLNPSLAKKSLICEYKYAFFPFWCQMYKVFSLAINVNTIWITISKNSIIRLFDSRHGCLFGPRDPVH